MFLARRNLINRAFSVSRAPGRIFANYEQSSSPNDSASAAPSSSNYEAPVENRRYTDNVSSTSNEAKDAFSGESNQDYNLESFKNASEASFPAEIVNVLSEPIEEHLIEIKPDGSCYLPEVHYRRILNKAFGIGGWSLIPRGPHSIQGNVISREYALFAHGRFISQARGHTSISGSFQNPAMSTESVRSNSLMRCCKDLGIASSLWDNSITAQWKAKFAIRKTVTDYQGRNKILWEKKRSNDQY